VEQEINYKTDKMENTHKDPEMTRNFWEGQQEFHQVTTKTQEALLIIVEEGEEELE
jgi:hypothetical protein